MLNIQSPNPISLYRRTKNLLQNAGLRPRKSFGQTFLVDAGILDAIVEAAELSPDDLVLEIGAGTGTLTERLALSSGRVVAVELDEGLFGILQSICQNKANVTLVHGDILDLDFSSLLDEKAGFTSAPTRIKIISNLPYYITKPILMKILDESSRLPIQMALLMVQEEVGTRMIASPGTKDYGVLTIGIAYRSDAEILRRISADSFYPKPKVSSALVRLNMRAEPPVDVNNERLFFQVVKAAFQHRRKTLRNALRLACQSNEERDSVDSAMQTLGLDPKRRGETLSIAEFADLANVIWR